VRTFRTVRRELEALRDWLKAAGVRHVGMESTGVYWRPVYAVLERHVELIVGNARHIRNVPGRKTDVKDAEWIADLVRHGLIAKSFVPPAPLRELRELLRYRRKLIEAQAAERNPLLRLLETANLKLASVMSEVFGVSGRAMLKALVAASASICSAMSVAKTVPVGPIRCAARSVCSPVPEATSRTRCPTSTPAKSSIRSVSGLRICARATPLRCHPAATSDDAYVPSA
jgi:transposase